MQSDAKLNQAIEDIRGLFVEISDETGLSGIDVEDINGQKTVVLTFFNEATRDKKMFPDNPKNFHGCPVKYNYTVTHGQAATIDMRYPL